MLLKTVHITEYKSITDSNEFETTDITCLVGKNEAGKSAILQALYKLNPIEEDKGDFSVTDDYPRFNVEDYRADVEDEKRDPAAIVQVSYELEAADILLVENVFGKQVLKNNTLGLTKGYSNTRIYSLAVDEAKVLSGLIQKSDIEPVLKKSLKELAVVEEMVSVLAPLEQTPEIVALKTKLDYVAKECASHYIFNKILKKFEPKFLYFDEYYQMQGMDNLEALKARKDAGTLEPHDHPVIGLINLARLKMDELINPERTQELKNRLEGAGNHLTKRIIKYWSQNKHLQIKFDVRPARPKDPEHMRSGNNIWGEVNDTKHWVSTGLETRSKGFVWFFSFLAWYSDVQKNNKNLILLLDEPGLFLHGKAQKDLLNYFEQEIKPQHQLIYTTHSPFMVDANRFDRVRIVEDKSIDAGDTIESGLEGTKVRTDILEVSDDSLFPLQGALGYDICQSLFVGSNSLIIEGVSDLLFINAVSSVLERNSKIGLDPRWTLTPVGGSDKVPTFASLLGSQGSLNVATLIDFQKKDHQSIENLYKKKILAKSNVLTYADFTSHSEADVEDMFDENFYLELVNGEYDSKIKLSDLDSSIPRVVVRIEKYIEKNPFKDSASFNHYRPARYLIDNLSKLESKLGDDALKRFESAFIALNSLIR